MRTFAEEFRAAANQWDQLTTYEVAGSLDYSSSEGPDDPSHPVAIRWDSLSGGAQGLTQLVCDGASWTRFNRDTIDDWDEPGLFRAAALHEIGHLMGLSHSNYIAGRQRASTSQYNNVVPIMTTCPALIPPQGSHSLTDSGGILTADDRLNAQLGMMRFGSNYTSTAVDNPGFDDPDNSEGPRPRSFIWSSSSVSWYSTGGTESPARVGFLPQNVNTNFLRQEAVLTKPTSRSAELKPGVTLFTGPLSDQKGASLRLYATQVSYPSSPCAAEWMTNKFENQYTNVYDPQQIVSQYDILDDQFNQYPNAWRYFGGPTYYVPAAWDAAIIEIHFSSARLTSSNQIATVNITSLEARTRPTLG